MSSEVGSGHVAVFPTFKGFRGKVDAETGAAATSGAKVFGRVFNKAGTTAGATAGRGFKTAFNSSSAGAGAAALKRLQGEVATSAKAVSASRLKEQDATGKLRVAEAQLAEARTKNTAGSARLVAAEEKAASAQRAVSAAAENTKEASSRLAIAQERVKTSATGAGSASSRSATGFRAAGGALRGLQSAAGGVARVLGTGIGLGVGLAAVNLLGRGIRRLTGYIGDSITTAAQWQTLNAQTAAVVKSTGGAAQVTSKHIGALSQRLENATATEAEAIQKGANLLLTFTGIRNEAGKGNKVFDQTTAVAVDMAKALGIDVSAAAMQLGKALNDPAKGLTKLQRSGVTFTDQQKKQVEALVKSGKTMQAQKLILRELNKEFGGSGAAYAKTYAGALYRIRDAAGDFGASIVSKALPGITKLLSTGADLINWAGGTNVVQEATAKLADGAGRLADKVLTLTEGLKGKSPLEGLFKVALPNVDFEQFTAGIQTAIGVARPILDAFFSYLHNIGPGVGAALSVIGPALAGVFVQLGPALQQALPLLGQAIVTLLPSAVQILQALLPLLPPIAQILTNSAPLISILSGVLVFLINNALNPLIQTLAGFTGVSSAFISGVNPMTIVLQALSGKFGVVIQAAANFGTQVGIGLRAVTGFFSDMSARVQGAMIQAGLFVSIGVARALAFLGRLGQIPAIGARAFGGLVAAVTGGIGRAVAGAGAGVSRVLATVGALPGRIRGVLGDLGSLLYRAGASIVDGLARGIRDAIGNATRAASDLMGAVSQFLPHSPAKKGPLSGKGWSLYSGRATGTGYAEGLLQSTSTIRSASSTAMRAAMLQQKSAVASSSLRSQVTSASATASSGPRPIYMDDTLVGWMVETADRVSRIVLNKQNADEERTTRMGVQGPVFG